MFGTASDLSATCITRGAADDENHAAFEFVFSAGDTHLRKLPRFRRRLRAAVLVRWRWPQFDLIAPDLGIMRDHDRGSAGILL